MPYPNSLNVSLTRDQKNRNGIYCCFTFRLCGSHSQEEPPLLQELTRETHLKVLQPRMLSGPLQGRFLSLLSKLTAPQHILEVGTFTGYATLCLAEGLAEEGKSIRWIEMKNW